MRFAVLIFLSFLAAGPVLAVQPDEILQDAALEARARAISGRLRCLVCQNQSIDDSDAPLAKDLRVLIREHLTKGETDGQVMDFVVARYGDFVLLKPPFTSRTAILWVTPFAALLLAFVAFYRRRNRPVAPGELPLSDEERAALEKIQT